MVTFDCAASRHDGVTLVTVQLRDVAVPTRVTVRNRLDGPVWPPRREGLPEAGWTDDGFAGVVGPGSHALGYATPAAPDDPPAELADAVAAPDAQPVDERTERPADLVRELGDPSPPGDAVPTVDCETGGDAVPTADCETDGSTAVADADDATATADRASPAADTQATTVQTGALADATDSDACHESNGRPRGTAQLPPALGPWLAEMERRTDAAEALAAAETVTEATAAVRQAGGLDGVRALADAPDERQLRLVASRLRRLARRRSEAAIPVETLSALA